MQLYSCKVRLNSNVMHEVVKAATVPEIIILRIVHGKLGEEPGGFDPVIDIKPMIGRFQMVRDAPGDAENKDEHKSTDKEERARLERVYGGALRKSKRYPSLDSVFGVGQPLPKTADGVPETLVLDKPPVRTVVDPNAAALGELA